MTENTIPPGYCQCGCGGKTPISERTVAKKGLVRGEPRRYIKGHNAYRTIDEKFWSHVAVAGPDECWLWTASKSRLGYGRAYYEDKHTEAHRVSWAIHFGSIPTSINVCHKCDNPACINPAHLFLGTDKENMADKYKKGRANHPKGEAVASSVLTEDAVRLIRHLATTGEPRWSLSLQFGVSAVTIGNIINRKTWKHVP